MHISILYIVFFFFFLFFIKKIKYVCSWLVPFSNLTTIVAICFSFPKMSSNFCVCKTVSPSLLYGIYKPSFMMDIFKFLTPCFYFYFIFFLNHFNNKRFLQLVLRRHLGLIISKQLFYRNER